MNDKVNIIHNDNAVKQDIIKDSNFDTVGSMFDDERGSRTIEKELEEFSSLGSTGKEEINSKIEDKIGIDLDDLGGNEESAFDEFENDSSVEQLEDEEQDEDTVEDYYSSAEFVIWIIELVIVWGTNVYLKKNNLDKISIKEFKKTNSEQKFLTKSWAKVLHKHKFKVSPELELIMAMGSAYVMKIKGIIERQELRKEKSDFEKKKEAFKKRTQKPKPPNENVVDITSNQKSSVNTVVSDSSERFEEKPKIRTKITKENFRLNPKGIEEVDKAVEEESKEVTENSDLIEN